MANIYKGTLGLIGNTPLVESYKCRERNQDLNAKILVKLDKFNSGRKECEIQNC